MPERGGIGSMKNIKMKYLILLVTALLIAIVLILYIIGVKRNAPQDDKQAEPNQSVLVGERITKAEAIRLFSYFYYTDTERMALTDKNTFSDTEGTWYDSYVNAAVHAGYLATGSGKLNAEKPLTCGEFRDMLVRICKSCGIRMEVLVKDWPKRLETARNKDELLLEEFLFLYRRCMEIAVADGEQQEAFPIARTSFLVVNVKTEGDEQFLIDEMGKRYRCSQFQDYSDVLAVGSQEERNDTEREADVIRNYPQAESYLYTVPEVLYCGNEIVFVIGQDDRAVTIPNALIVYGTGDTLDTYINGDGRKLHCVFPLNETIEKRVADITIQNKKVSGLVMKPDVIRGKVLMTGSGQIEVEGYGRLPLQENYRIYKLHGEYSMEPTNSILVGYSNVTFVVEGEEICAALITEAIRAENIRVLISVDKTSNYYHRQLVLSSEDAYVSVVGTQEQNHLPGEELVLDYEALRDSGERVFVRSASESGKIRVESIQRSYGHPQYRGSLEVIATEDGMLLVNELPLEEYLYSVVPSEMPVSHGSEALKVQAVCARSYAYQQLMANRYARYGAHVDDTVNCQVYNNVAETSSSVFAVKDTYGKVMQYEDAVVTAFYFSTSSGYTSSIEEVWEDYQPIVYFQGEIQLTGDSQNALLSEAVRNGIVEATGSKDEQMQQLVQMVNLSQEEAFRDFIREETLWIEKDGKQLQKKVQTYDSGFSWYRWQVSLDAVKLSEQLDRLLAKQIAAGPKDILTLVSTEGQFLTPGGTLLDGNYETAAITTVGKIQSITVVTRAKSGMITELLIRGSANTILVRNQTNIRTLLAPADTTVYLANNVTVDGFSLLPSAFFYVEPGSSDGRSVFVIHGGGYGHGVGMSQNGVKSLADTGYTYEGILEHYYNGISIGFIY